VAQHTAAAFDELMQQLLKQQQEPQQNSTHTTTNHHQHHQNIILDSGCGTGRSSLLLGQQYADCVVIGVDRSLVRLSSRKEYRQLLRAHAYDARQQQQQQQQQQQPLKDEVEENGDDTAAPASGDYYAPAVEHAAPNVWLVRAELVDFWRLLLQHRQRQTSSSSSSNQNTASLNFTISQHYLLYPNPYPKSKRLKQRWYAHPSFPLLLAQADGTTILRSNWKQYLEEFAEATEIMNEYNNNNTSSYTIVQSAPIRELLLHNESSTTALTNFEQKYRVAGERCFELILNHHHHQQRR